MVTSLFFYQKTLSKKEILDPVKKVVKTTLNFYKGITCIINQVTIKIKFPDE